MHERHRDGAAAATRRRRGRCVPVPAAPATAYRRDPALGQVSARRWKSQRGAISDCRRAATDPA